MAGPSLSGLINPQILEWARKSARLSVEDAAQRASISTERLSAFEHGTQAPTLAQLRKIANIYKRGVPVFFLDAIPKGTRQPVDYRRIELRVSETMSPALAIAIREASSKREAALSLFADLEDEPPEFALRAPASASGEQLGEYLASALGLPPSARQSWSTHYDALNGWRSAVERAGVLVMQVSRIGLEEMRGCSLAFDPLPVILLNGSDAPLGRVFTLLHELAHLSRSESGLCDLLERDDSQPDSQDTSSAIETLCNRAAGAALLPRDVLLQMEPVQRAGQSSQWEERQLDSLKSKFWASREAVLRRLLILGKTSQRHYTEWRARFRREYAEMREAGSGGFVPPPRNVVLKNGRFLTGLAVDAYEASAITGSELSRLLGTKLNHLPAITAILREQTSE